MACSETIGELLLRLEPDEESANAAAAKIRILAYGPGRALLKKARLQDDPKAEDADLATSGTNGVLLEPMCELGPREDLHARRDFIDELRVRGTDAIDNISRALDEMLDHHAPVAVAVEHGEPVSANPIRVCDSAYLAARQILLLDPTRAAQSASRRRFLAQTVPLRDQEIETQRSSAGWKRLVHSGSTARQRKLELAAPQNICLERVARDSYVQAVESSPGAMITSLNRPLVADTLMLPRALMSLARGDDPQLAAAAKRVTAELGGLLLWPLLELDAPSRPDEQGEYVEDLRRTHEVTRSSVTGALIQLLDDKRDLLPPSTEGLPVDEVERPRRVCAHAFLALLALSMVGRGDDLDDSESAFLVASNLLQDELIAEGKKTGVWRPLTAEESAADAKNHPSPEQVETDQN